MSGLLSNKPTSGPKCGQILSVRSVESGSNNVYLRFTEWPGEEIDMRFAHDRFRKVTPNSDIEGVEEHRRIPETVE